MLGASAMQLQLLHVPVARQRSTVLLLLLLLLRL
jgi:hypothetical protein